MKTLDTIAKVWTKCHKCRIGSWAHRHVFFDGSPYATFMFVGEGPGVTEDVLGTPFVGASGRLLREVLVEHFDKSEWCLTNLVACRPCDGPNEPNRAPQSDEILNCDNRLRDTIKVVRPKVLIAVGNIPMQWLTENHSLAIIKKIYHPAYILRNGGAKGSKFEEWVASIKKIKEGTR